MKVLLISFLLAGCAAEDSSKPIAVPIERQEVAGSSNPTARGNLATHDQQLLRFVSDAEQLRNTDPAAARALFRAATELFDDLNDGKMTDRGRDAGAHAQFRGFEYDAEEIVSSVGNAKTNDEVGRLQDQIREGAKWVRSYRQPVWTSRADALEASAISQLKMSMSPSR